MINNLYRVGLMIIALGLIFPALPARAASVPLDQLADKAMYRTEQQISGYKDVEKTGYREVEKTGYRDVEVEKTGYKDVVKYREETVTKQVPYTKKVPVYDWVVTGYYAKKGTVILKTPKLNANNDIEVRTKNKMYTAATTDKEVKLTKVNNSFGKANGVTYTTYANVSKKTYTYTAKQAVQAYTKTDTKKKLTAINSKGKKDNVQVSKNTKLTKVNSKWYKASINYSNYKKVKSKWKKYTKKSTVYVPAKYVKTTTKTTKVWTKQTKKVNGYFYLDTGDIRKTKVWKQVGTRTEKGYKTVTETVKVPYTVTEEYTYTEIEKQPYTYIETEEYTYIDQEPIYETVKVENSTKDKYKAIVNFYSQYRLSESEMLELFDRVGVHYTVINGYDLSRFVTGASTVNGVTKFYRFTPDTNVKLVIFDDGSAINLSYLLSVRGKSYEDVKINAGGWQL